MRAATSSSASTGSATAGSPTSRPLRPSRTSTSAEATYRGSCTSRSRHRSATRSSTASWSRSARGTGSRGGRLRRRASWPSCCSTTSPSSCPSGSTAAAHPSTTYPRGPSRCSSPTSMGRLPTSDLLEGKDGLTPVDLGSYALKGLDRAEPLLHLVAAGLPSGLPVPRARGVSSVKLPTHLTALVGREEEIEAIVSRLEPHHVRLVTLTGPGGIGKTRLATAAAERAAAAYPDGVFFVPLADARDAEQVVAAAGESIGVRGEGARPLLETIQERLAADRVLLVLDNFEQVLEEASVVAALLDGCPGTDVLVTSRAPLRVRGEWEHPVDPLATPAAVQLFLDRARTTRPDWEPSAGELEAVEEVLGTLERLV